MNPARHRSKILVIGLLALALIATSGCEQWSADRRSGEQHGISVGQLVRKPSAPTPPDEQHNQIQNQGQTDLITVIADVAEAVRPTVFFISVRAVAPGEFLQPVPREGVGSGIIVDPSGLVLTNNHVIENAQRIRVVLADGRAFEAAVVGRDPLADIAVLNIEGEDIPAAPLGSSSALRVGQWVVAIGNALGLEGGPTVTQGIVSALECSIEADGGAILENLIQTSAAINPGNSGGPLVNLDGEVVGINTAVPGPTVTGLQPTGIGFAIAIDAAKPIASELVQQGRVRRPFLGVSSVTVTSALAAQLDLGVRYGALVIEVARGSPAAQAGIEEGDVIVEFAGENIESARELRQKVMAQEIGETATITAVRDAQRVELSVTLEERPAPPSVGSQP